MYDYDCETREVESTPQRVDKSLVRNEHDWAVCPQENVSFKQIVEENSYPRVDAGRYRLIFQAKAQKARDCFSKLCGRKTLFYIPDTLACDRTFARDVEEVYYIDAMDGFLQETGALDVLDLPILKRDLSHRAFSAFSKRPYFFRELYYRLQYNVWSPHDAWENSYYSYPELCSVFPRLGRWMRDIKQPSGLPVPGPFAIFYFHTELTDAQFDDESTLKERVKRLRFCVKHEYLVLFLAVWWLEAIYGCRQHIVDKTAIDVLERHCGRIPTIAGKSVPAIIEHMRCAERCQDIHLNWLVFDGNCLEYSTFLWSGKNFGEFDSQRRAGRTFRLNLKKRKIVDVDDEQGITWVDDCVLDRVIAGPDLGKVSGLLPIIMEEGWLGHGNIRIGDLLYNLVHLYNRTLDNSNSMLQAEKTRQLIRDRPMYRNDYDNYGHETYGNNYRDYNDDRIHNSDRVGYDHHRVNNSYAVHMRGRGGNSYKFDNNRCRQADNTGRDARNICYKTMSGRGTDDGGRKFGSENRDYYYEEFGGRSPIGNGGFAADPYCNEQAVTKSGAANHYNRRAATSRSNERNYAQTRASPAAGCAYAANRSTSPEAGTNIRRQSPVFCGSQELEEPTARAQNSGAVPVVSAPSVATNSGVDSSSRKTPQQLCAPLRPILVTTSRRSNPGPFQPTFSRVPTGTFPWGLHEKRTREDDAQQQNVPGRHLKRSCTQENVETRANCLNSDLEVGTDNRDQSDPVLTALMNRHPLILPARSEASYQKRTEYRVITLRGATMSSI